MILSKTLNFAWPTKFDLMQVANPRGTILLLHGYLQNGNTLLQLLRNYLPETWTIIAPNGLFPVAHRYGSKLRLAYTWYFYDPPNDRYLLNMDQACSYLKSLVELIQIDALPVKIIGYSQGGYLAPFAAQYIPHVDQVIGINCRFRSETLKAPLPFVLDAIHGDMDQMVDPTRAKDCHQTIIANGTKGRFRQVPNSDHRITPAIGHTLRYCLGQA